MTNNKIALVTGATGGMGKVTAFELAKLGFTVIIHGRNQAKTEQTVNEIRQRSGNDHVDFILADLFKMDEVKAMTETFSKTYDRLDVLINNAGGIMNKTREITEDGFEKTLAINLLAPFLLTELLLPHLKISEDGRIINVTSDAHKLSAKPDFTDIDMVATYSPLTAYGNAKLYLIWVTQYLAQTLSLSNTNNVTVNTVHPGVVATNFGVGSDLGPILNFLLKLARPFNKTPEQGAETTTYLATSNDVKTTSGQYFVDKKPAKAAYKYFTTANQQLIWDYCLEKTKPWQ